MSSIGSISKLTALKTLVALLGLIYSIVQIKVFGTSKSIEIYFAAQSIAYLATSLSQSGQLSEVFLPEYIKTKEVLGLDGSSELYSSIVNRITVYTTVLLTALFITAPLLVNMIVPGFTLDDKVLVVDYFRVLLPYIFLTIQFAFLNTILNAENIYGRSEIGGIIATLISFILVLMYGTSVGPRILIITAYIGICIQILLSLIFAFKVGIRYSFVYRVDHFDYQKFFSKLKSTLTYTIATQFLNIAYNAGLSYMSQGVYAVFQYVWKIFPKLSGIISSSFSTVYFTLLTKKIADNRISRDEIHSLLSSIQKVALQISLVLSSAYFFIGRELLQLLWLNKKFTYSNLLLADGVFKALFVVFLFQTSYLVMRKYTVALGLAKYLYYFQAISQMASALIIFSLLRYFRESGLIPSILIGNFMLMIVPVIVLYRLASIEFIFRDKAFMKRYLFAIFSTALIWVLWNKYSFDLLINLNINSVNGQLWFNLGAYALCLLSCWVCFGWNISKTLLSTIKNN